MPPWRRTSSVKASGSWWLRYSRRRWESEVMRYPFAPRCGQRRDLFSDSAKAWQGVSRHGPGRRPGQGGGPPASMVPQERRHRHQLLGPACDLRRLLRQPGAAHEGVGEVAELLPLGGLLEEAVGRDIDRVALGGVLLGRGEDE